LQDAGLSRWRCREDSDIDAVSAIGFELFDFFEEEAEELLPQLGMLMRQWSRDPVT
jgi:chemosensory pili system protein ChpA (sensor histidine kinase/response regulator)